MSRENNGLLAFAVLIRFVVVIVALVAVVKFDLDYRAYVQPFVDRSNAEEQVFRSFKPNALFAVDFDSGTGRRCLPFLGYQRQGKMLLTVWAKDVDGTKEAYDYIGSPQERVAAGCTPEETQAYYESVEVNRQYVKTELRLKQYASFFARLHSGDRFTVNYDGSEDFCQTFVSMKRDHLGTDYFNVTSKLDGTDLNEEMYSGAEHDVHAGCASKHPT